MPFGDGTGPLGAGSKTGWGRGRCAGAMGFGRGMSIRRWFGGWGGQPGGVNAPDEKGLLERQAGMLQDQLEAVKRRLGELDKK